MSHGLDTSTISTEDVTVTNAEGDPHPITLQVYYGEHSHLVNLKPKEDWEPDTDYTVTVSPPLASWDGIPYATTASFTFSTKPEPEVQPEPPVESAGGEVRVNTFLAGRFTIFTLTGVTL